jgi:serine/threonine protein kinase
VSLSPSYPRVPQGENLGSAGLDKVTDLGRYRLIAELARGGMGIVYVALVRGPAGFNKLFVVKELMPQFALDPSFMSMFLAEARLAARLSHPNIVQTLEIGEERGRPFIAMEYLEGHNFQRIVQRAARRGGRVPLPIQLHVLMATLSGLHYAHELRDFDGTPLHVVHRDASPHNVFVTYDGQVKVVDFGIAKMEDASSERTRTGVLKGKVSYMAPEQTRGESADRRADVFAVGVMLWEALTGRRMWKAESEVAILHARLLHAIVPPRSIAPEVPEALDEITMRALASDPRARYATAAEMRAEIDAYLREFRGHADAREVGAYVSQLFTEERAEIKRRIDAQVQELRRLRSGEFGAVSLMRIPTPLGGLTPSNLAPSTTPPGATVVSSYPNPPKRASALRVVASIGALSLVTALVLMSVRALRSNDEATVSTTPTSPTAPTTASAAETAPPPPAATALQTPLSGHPPDASRAELTRVTAPMSAARAATIPRATAHLPEPPPAEPTERRHGEKPIREIDLTDPYDKP